ncbi:MAG: bifunctional glycosyltransferase family 2/GtrA family protein [Pseudomonadota bacterium]
MVAVAVIVPAYNPPAEFYEVLDGIRSLGDSLEIVVVDDGSAACFDADKLKSLHVRSIRLPTNRGKGAALKAGFRYVAAELRDIETVVTVDADGQHLKEDIAAVLQTAADRPGSFVLGVREFDGDVPFRSALGNAVTQGIFNQFTKTDIRDTQTGLRAYPVAFAETCCDISSNRYEFELKAILAALDQDLVIEQVPITTRYDEGNKSSHFRPLIDSMRVLAVFLRFLFISLSSFSIDIALFFVMYTATSDIVSSTYVARLVSATFNFSANKLFVFKSFGRKRTLIEVAGYGLLAVVVATLSALLVQAAVNSFSANVVMIKVVVDCLLFAVSFLTQRYLLFNAGRAA